VLFRTYTGIIFHTSLEDAQHIFIAVSIGTCFLALGNPIWFKLEKVYLIPFSVIGIEFFITIFCMTALRLFVKMLYLELRQLRKEKKDVIIYGASHNAVLTKKALERDAGTHYQVMAFIDTNSRNTGQKIEGVTIYSPQDFEKLLSANVIGAVILANDNLSGQEKQEIVDSCLKYSVPLRNVPPARQWINGELSFRQIRDLKIEDILERDPIEIDWTVIQHQIRHKTVLITGAAGSIGSEIARQILRFEPARLILLDQAETPMYELDLEMQTKWNFTNYEIVVGDVRNLERMRRVFAAFSPQIIYHAAAYKHVPLMEDNPSEAVLTNVSGTKIMADCAVEFKVEKFVFISTDKAVNPTNIMGASKRVAEIYIQALNDAQPQTRFVTVRFGNVLGSNGSVIPLFKRQIEAGGPITVTDPEMTRFFMTIPEACQLVLEAGAMGKGGEIFVFDMGESVKIVDLARKMIRLMGLQEGRDIQILFTGLRPGEKLYEELLNNEETTLPTHHSKILIAKVRTYSFETISEHIARLKQYFDVQENEPIVRLLKEIVPEYKSNNSIYEDLDND
jgi:FlaA1/EpsC-like NDP-sugar epimerase